MDYDIIIVGGGMVGATIASALGVTALRVAVIEHHSVSTEPDLTTCALRVSAITRASQNLFAQIGAWSEMVEMRVSPYRTMHVWDATGRGQIDFDSAEIGEPDLGHIIENRVIQAALLRCMARFDTIDLYAPATCAIFNRAPGRVSITLEDGRTLSARLVIGTDGADSWVRTQAGIATTGWHYRQAAVIATIRTSRHHGEAAYQRFMPSGPLAFLPLRDGRSSIVWSTLPAQAEELMALPEDEFLDRLQQAFGERLGRMEAVDGRDSFPLTLQHANRYTSARLALAGNAAHTIHPLAGQGFNLGALDAAALVETLLDARNAGRDIGEYTVLRRYERWRKGNNLAMMATMDAFKRLFGNDRLPLGLLRNLGLTLTNRSGPVKQALMRRAMGTVGDLPYLTRGMPLPLHSSSPRC